MGNRLRPIHGAEGEICQTRLGIASWGSTCPQLAYAFLRASKKSQRMALEKETAAMKTTREKALSDVGTVRTERSTSASR